jgi:TolA-binding protein
MSGVEMRAWSSVGFGLLYVIALSGCGRAPAPSATNQTLADVVDSDTVQSLQRQIRERDQHIAELTSQLEALAVQSLQRQIKEREKRITELEFQLEALKLIDQSTEKRRKPIRPPATLTPIE